MGGRKAATFRWICLERGKIYEGERRKRGWRGVQRETARKSIKRRAKYGWMLKYAWGGMRELWECEEKIREDGEREKMGRVEEEEWEEVEEDLEWGIRERNSEDGGKIEWWMERWRKEKCRGDTPLFITYGWAEVKWLSRGFWHEIETGGIIILINGWSGEEAAEEEEEGRRGEGI